MTDKTDYFSYIDLKVLELSNTAEPMICARCHLPIRVPGEYFVSVYDSMAQTTMYYHYSCYMQT